MEAPILTFPERANQLYELEKYFEGYNIVCITGEVGIGKTSAATQFFTYQLPNLVDLEMSLPLPTTLRDNWEHIISRLGRELLADEFPRQFNLSELEENIIDYISHHKIGLYLDLDKVEYTTTDITRFINTWRERVHNGSRLLITLRESPFKGKLPIPQECFEFELKGIAEAFLDRILGDRLFQFIRDNNRFDKLSQLKGNPQKLKYLSWLMPKEPEKRDIEKLDIYLDDMINKDFHKDTRAGQDVFEKIREFIKRNEKKLPLDHFLALGRIRALEFEESFIAFLWDSLGCGNTQLYVRSVESLINGKLLTIIPGSQWKIRLDAPLHMMLEEYCIDHFGENHIPLIDYFISEYYRNAFSASKEKSFNLDLLDHYVYHALRSGNSESAYSYVFDSDILNTAHSRGLALEMKTILFYFYSYWFINFIKDENLDSIENPQLAKQWAKILMALARICKDLSRHEKSLQYLSEANKILSRGIAKGIDNETRQEIQSKIWHYSGIAYSQVGKTSNCLEAYKSAVRNAQERGIFTTLDVLSLGYLSYEEKFYDIRRAEDLGVAALEICKEIDDPAIESVRIKNLCSLGQIRAFMGKIEDSKQNFNEAEKRCRQISKDSHKDSAVDIRELGRILINSAVIYIYTKEWKEVEKRLDEAFDLYKDSGDRRRKAMGIAYKGIMLYHQGEEKRKQGKEEGIKKVEEGKGKIVEAFKKHKEIKAQREMIYESLTYMWMKEPDRANRLARRITQNQGLDEEDLRFIKSSSEDMCNCIISANTTESQIFIKFWENYYKPTLLLDPANNGATIN